MNNENEVDGKDSNQTKKNKAYFAGDFHFGIPNDEESTRREKKSLSGLNL